MELISTMAEATLGPGFYITFEAIDPTTGANVTGVTLSQTAILAEDVSGGSATLALDNLPPLFLPLPLQDQADAPAVPVAA